MVKYFGISTFSFVSELTTKQKCDIIERLKRLQKFDVVVSDDRKDIYTYRSDCFADEGVRIWVKRQNGKPWELIIVVHPMLVLDDLDHSPLYAPIGKGEYQEIVETVDKLLDEVNIPCSVDEMKLHRVDTTVELTFNADISPDEYIRLLKKSTLLPHHKLDFFRAKEHKVQNYKRANKHSYTQYRKSSVFLAYGRAAQLEMVDVFPEVLIGKRTLRLEAQLQREGMKKWVGKDEMNGSNWSILKKLGDSSQNIILWYIDRLQLVEVSYFRHSDTLDMIERMQDKETRQQMLYLVQMINGDDSITTALENLKEEYHLSKSQCRAVLNSFYELGISPITLKSDSNHDELPSLDTIICYFFR